LAESTSSPHGDENWPLPEPADPQAISGMAEESSF
jgi:hypothetical protein